jgi:hypothetical protein
MVGKVSFDLRAILPHASSEAILISARLFTTEKIFHHLLRESTAEKTQEAFAPHPDGRK